MLSHSVGPSVGPIRVWRGARGSVRKASRRETSSPKTFSARVCARRGVTWSPHFFEKFKGCVPRPMDSRSC